MFHSGHYVNSSNKALDWQNCSIAYFFLNQNLLNTDTKVFHAVKKISDLIECLVHAFN